MKTKCIICDPLKSNSMKSKNPFSGFHQTEYAPTLDTSSQNPVRNGGGLLIYGWKASKSNNMRLLK